MGNLLHLRLRIQDFERPLAYQDTNTHSMHGPGRASLAVPPVARSELIVFQPAFHKKEPVIQRV
jgi:hypothetical protein